MVRISEKQLQDAEDRMKSRLGGAPHAVEAHYDPLSSKLVITLSSGVELLIPSHLAEGISTAQPEDLAEIDISPTGLGLHFPRLDADLYVPGLLAGVLGSRSFIAAQSAKGGLVKSPAKAAAARANGKLGGRPVKKPDGPKRTVTVKYDPKDGSFKAAEDIDAVAGKRYHESGSLPYYLSQDESKPLTSEDEKQSRAPGRKDLTRPG